MTRDTKRNLLVAATSLCSSVTHHIIVHKLNFDFYMFLGGWLLHLIMLLVVIILATVLISNNEYKFIRPRYARDEELNLKTSIEEMTVYVCFTILALSLVLIFFFGLGIQGTVD